jgi:hypothetical protein
VGSFLFLRVEPDLLSDVQASYTRRQQFQATLRLRLATRGEVPRIS